MLDRSEVGDFVAATSFNSMVNPQLSITQIDNIFNAMAMARGATGVDGVVMFGDLVAFMLKYQQCISHSRWRQLLELDDPCTVDAPAVSASSTNPVVSQVVYKAKWHGEKVAAKIPHPRNPNPKP